MQAGQPNLPPMARFVFQHLARTRNIGDRATVPARWLDFGPDVTVQHFGEDIPACDVAIFGGGQVYGQTFEAAVAAINRARHRVSWAVGMRGQAGSLRHDILSANLTLMGCRDVDVPGTVHVPCPSCLSPRFDAAPAPLHEVVIYAHHRHPIPATHGLPMEVNEGGTFAQKLAFLASGATVVSNSYHGVYWAMLLGRRVLALPFSDKFGGFAQMPATAEAGAWRAALPQAHAAEGYLEACRALNRAFHARVMNLT